MHGSLLSLVASMVRRTNLARGGGEVFDVPAGVDGGPRGLRGGVCLLVPARCGLGFDLLELCRESSRR